MELAYLAALLDRSGSFTASRTNAIGIRVTGPAELRRWLVLRFGGYDTTRAWCLERQADLAFLLPRLRPFLVIRTDECVAMEMLVTYMGGRESYHGDQEWRTGRQQLMDAVVAARRARGDR